MVGRIDKPDFWVNFVNKKVNFVALTMQSSRYCHFSKTSLTKVNVSDIEIKDDSGLRLMEGLWLLEFLEKKLYNSEQ